MCLPLARSFVAPRARRRISDDDSRATIDASRSRARTSARTRSQTDARGDRNAPAALGRIGGPGRAGETRLERVGGAPPDTWIHATRASTARSTTSPADGGRFTSIAIARRGAASRTRSVRNGIISHAPTLARDGRRAVGFSHATGVTARPRQRAVDVTLRGMALTVRATTIRASSVTRATSGRSFARSLARPARRTELSRARESVVANAEKPKISRENEKEAWLSEMEREGGNPLKDPMALIGIGGLAVPFIILAIASAAGFIGQ